MCWDSSPSYQPFNKSAPKFGCFPKTHCTVRLPKKLCQLFFSEAASASGSHCDVTGDVWQHCHVTCSGQESRGHQSRWWHLHSPWPWPQTRLRQSGQHIPKPMLAPGQPKWQHCDVIVQSCDLTKFTSLASRKWWCWSTHSTRHRLPWWWQCNDITESCDIRSFQCSKWSWQRRRHKNQQTTDSSKRHGDNLLQGRGKSRIRKKCESCSHIKVMWCPPSILWSLPSVHLVMWPRPHVSILPQGHLPVHHPDQKHCHCLHRLGPGCHVHGARWLCPHVQLQQNPAAEMEPGQDPVTMHLPSE